MSRYWFLPAAVTAALACSGCGTEQSPEQMRADSALVAGNAAIVRDDYPAARQEILSALRLDTGLNRRARIAEETRLLGDVASAGASFDSAFYWYGESQGGFKGLADRSGVRDITLRVAALRRKMGEERKAFTMYVDALRLARVFHDDEGVRDIQWAMLPCARALDEQEEESDIIRELLQGYTAAGDVAHQAAVFLASGDGKFLRRSFDGGAEDYLRALMLADQARAAHSHLAPGRSAWKRSCASGTCICAGGSSPKRSGSSARPLPRRTGRETRWRRDTCSCSSGTATWKPRGSRRCGITGRAWSC